MQVDRLFQIIYLLLERKTITAKELAEKFEVSTRTIYRDIEVLSAARIPIYTSKGKNGGICILDNYILDKSLLSEEEQYQILFALQGMEKISYSDGKRILEKMSSLFQKSKTNWIEEDFSDWGIEDKEEDVFYLIKDAILNQRILTFVYYNSYGEKSIRKVEPLQIYFKNRAWYLKAYCKEKEDYRLFKITRMREIKVLQENFHRKLPDRIQKKEEIKKVCLELEISKIMSYRVFDEFREEEISINENGNFNIKVEYPQNDWVYGYILYFGENIKVVSPGWVREKIKEKLKKKHSKLFLM